MSAPSPFRLNLYLDKHTECMNTINPSNRTAYTQKLVKTNGGSSCEVFRCYSLNWSLTQAISSKVQVVFFNLKRCVILGLIRRWQPMLPTNASNVFPFTDPMWFSMFYCRWILCRLPNFLPFHNAKICDGHRNSWLELADEILFTKTKLFWTDCSTCSTDFYFDLVS